MNRLRISVIGHDSVKLGQAIYCEIWNMMPEIIP